MVREFGLKGRGEPIVLGQRPGREHGKWVETDNFKIKIIIIINLSIENHQYGSALLKTLLRNKRINVEMKNGKLHQGMLNSCILKLVLLPVKL